MIHGSYNLPYMKSLFKNGCSLDYYSCTSEAKYKAILVGGVLTKKTMVIDWCGNPHCNGMLVKNPDIFIKLEPYIKEK
jgi:hypothetical protein